jgi:hypothetical protein
MPMEGGGGGEGDREDVMRRDLRESWELVPHPFRKMSERVTATLRREPEDAPGCPRTVAVSFSANSSGNLKSIFVWTVARLFASFSGSRY